MSTQDISVHENDKVTLICNVTGIPTPEVTWFRHDGPGGINKESKLNMQVSKLYFIY